MLIQPFTVSKHDSHARGSDHSVNDLNWQDQKGNVVGYRTSLQWLLLWSCK